MPDVPPEAERGALTLPDPGFDPNYLVIQDGRVVQWIRAAHYAEAAEKQTEPGQLWTVCG